MLDYFTPDYLDLTIDELNLLANTHEPIGEKA